MAKTDLGTKRVCPETGRKFYDLGKTPVISPYTGKVVPIVVPPPSRARPEPAAPVRGRRLRRWRKPKRRARDRGRRICFARGRRGRTAGQEAGAPKARLRRARGRSRDRGESLDDAAFIEEEEEGDPDVTDIIGETIEKEEET